MGKNIHRLGRDDSDRLLPLIASYQFNPYRQYQIDRSILESYVIDEIVNLLSNRDNFALAAEERGALVGLISVEKLGWDTKYFGMQMARMPHLIVSNGYPQAFELKCELITRILSECHKENIRHISARVAKEDTSSIHALESKGFRLMDVIITGSVDLRNREITQTENRWPVREFNSNDIPKLVDIAIKSFGEQPIAKHRFHADPFLPQEKSNYLYVQWLLSSCKGLADTVLVAEMNETPVGFIACKVERQLSEKIGIRLGVVFLTAVTPSARQKGVYPSMLNAALNWFSGKVDIVETGAEVSNYAVQRGWNKLGFKVVRSQCTFHWSRRMGRRFSQEGPLPEAK
jgi:ribosomal protein S18 acetylase RimI-like enzyme